MQAVVGTLSSLCVWKSSFNHQSSDASGSNEEHFHAPAIRLSGNIVVADPAVQCTFTDIASPETDFGCVVDPLCGMVRRGRSSTIFLGNATTCAPFHQSIKRSAEKLLERPDGSQPTDKKLTISWFTISANGDETLTDELWHASHVGIASKAPELHLRELGYGKGMLVPGLWEIECGSADEVMAVVQHVQSKLPHLASEPAHGRPFHCVFQLTVPAKKPISPNSTSTSAKKNFVAMGALADRAAAGRLTLIQLGSVASTSEGHSEQAALSVPLALRPWVQHLRTVMLWLQNRQASTPFHRSRVVLLLKDLLLRRQNGAAVLCVDPGEQGQGGALAQTIEWLRLFAQFNTLAVQAQSTTQARSDPPISPAGQPSATDATLLAQQQTQPQSSVQVQVQAEPQSHSQSQSPKGQEVRAGRSRLNSTASSTSLSDVLIGRARTDSTASAAAEGPCRRRSSSAGRAGAGGPRLFRSTVRASQQAGDLAEAAGAAVAAASAETGQRSAGDASKNTRSAGAALTKAGSLTPKEMTTAMRELAKRNKLAALKAAAQAERELVPPHLAEIRSLREKLSVAEGEKAALAAERDAAQAARALQEELLARLRADLQAALERIEELTRENVALKATMDSRGGEVTINTAREAVKGATASVVGEGFATATSGGPVAMALGIDQAEQADVEDTGEAPTTAIAVPEEPAAAPGFDASTSFVCGEADTTPTSAPTPLLISALATSEEHSAGLPNSDEGGEDTPTAAVADEGPADVAEDPGDSKTSESLMMDEGREDQVASPKEQQELYVEAPAAVNPTSDGDHVESTANMESVASQEPAHVVADPPTEDVHPPAAVPEAAADAAAAAPPVDVEAPLVVAAPSVPSVSPTRPASTVLQRLRGLL